MITFGQKIRELRKERRWTQRELAEKLNVDFSYISKIENERVDNPPSEELIRNMAVVFSVDAEELLDLAGNFDSQVLRGVVAKIPEAGVLLRRLQKSQFSQKDIQEFLQKTGDSHENN